MSVSAAVRNPRAFVGGKWNRFKVLLLDPERFFEEKASTDRIWNEVIVLLVIGLAGAAGILYVGQEFMTHFVTNAIDQSPGQVVISGERGLRIQVYGLRSVLGMYILWSFLTVAYYSLSWLYSDYGSFFQTAKLTAWTLVPVFFANIVKSIAAAYVITTQTIIESPVSQQTEIVDNVKRGEAGEAAGYLFGLLYEEPIMLAALGIGLLFLIWSGYIAAYAVATVRDIPVSDAYKVVAAPLVVYALWSLNTLLGHAGVL
jgi:hypothetical protein